MVSAEDIILGSTVVGVERRINFLESIVINLAAINKDGEGGGIAQYPIGGGDPIGILAAQDAHSIDVSKRDGFTLISETVVGLFRIALWEAVVGELWFIRESGEPEAFGVARDRSGNAYATSGAASGARVVKYNSSQVLQWETSEWETDPGPPPVMDNFTVARGCALTPDEQHIWVCDRGVRIVKFATSDGSYVSEITLGFQPVYVAIDVSGFLYITDPNARLIHRYNSAGTFISSWGGGGTGDGAFTAMFGIAVATSRRSNNDVFVFVFDGFRPGTHGLSNRVNVYAKNGGFRWDADLPTSTAAAFPLAIAWGAQTEWFYYPTEDQSDSVSAGTPDGGFAVPALNFYENQIIRSNIIGHMHIVIEILAAAFINAATGNTFNWTGSDNDNLYHVAVEAEEYDWLRPRKADLQGETIRPDEITEIELCLTKLEQSFPVTP